MHIELNDVTIDSRHGPILSGVTLSIASPTCMVITGPASCGKSTLLALISGSVAASTGTLSVDGAPLPHGSTRTLRQYQRRLGVISQIPVLDGGLTVFENILLASAARGLGREQATAASLEALADVGLSHRRAHEVRELSDAERTLGGIARAFVGGVEMLLIDDAFVGLDEPTLRSALDIIVTTATKREIGMIVTTTDATLADLVPGCQRHTMHEGRLSPLQEVA